MQIDIFIPSYPHPAHFPGHGGEPHPPPPTPHPVPHLCGATILGISLPAVCPRIPIVHSASHAHIPSWGPYISAGIWSRAARALSLAARWRALHPARPVPGTATASPSPSPSPCRVVSPVSSGVCKVLKKKDEINSDEQNQKDIKETGTKNERNCRESSRLPRRHQAAGCKMPVCAPLLPARALSQTRGTTHAGTAAVSTRIARDPSSPVTRRRRRRRENMNG
jgi:hypothetical protein